MYKTGFVAEPRRFSDHEQHSQLKSCREQQLLRRCCIWTGWRQFYRCWRYCANWKQGWHMRATQHRFPVPTIGRSKPEPAAADKTKIRTSIHRWPYPTAGLQVRAIQYPRSLLHIKFIHQYPAAFCIVQIITEFLIACCEGMIHGVSIFNININIRIFR